MDGCNFVLRDWGPVSPCLSAFWCFLTSPLGRLISLARLLRGETFWAGPPAVPPLGPPVADAGFLLHVGQLDIWHRILQVFDFLPTPLAPYWVELDMSSRPK